jgi:hypothetical protein
MKESPNIKLLLAGIVLIVVLGLGGFLYRNALEHPASLTQTACTLEAKICPDGTTVGRTGPSCAFAPCLPPNISFDSVGIAFALPSGYVADKQAADSDPAILGAYIKSSTSTNALQPITIRRFVVPTGSTTDQIILSHTVLSPSEMAPKSMDAFKPKIIGTRTYSSIVIERFEGVVHSAYFLVRAKDVLEFDIVEQDVMNWMDPALIPDNLPAHQALIKMLGTLEDSSS